MALVSHNRPVARLDDFIAYLSYVGEDEKCRLFRELRCLEPQLFESIAKESTEESSKQTSSPTRNGQSSIASQNPTSTQEQEGPTAESTVRTASTNALEKASNRPLQHIPKCFQTTPSGVMQLLYTTNPETFFMKNDGVASSDILDALLQINNNNWLNAIRRRFHAIALYSYFMTEKQKSAVRDQGQVFSDFIRKGKVIREGFTKKALVKTLKDHCNVGGRYMNFATGLSWSALLSLRPDRWTYYEKRISYLEGTAFRDEILSTLKAEGLVYVKTAAEESIECKLEAIACKFRDWIYETWRERIVPPTTNPEALAPSGTKSKKRKHNDGDGEQNGPPREPPANTVQFVAVNACPRAEASTYTNNLGVMTVAQAWQPPFNVPTSYATEQQAHQLDAMMAAQDSQPFNPPTSYATEQQAHQLDLMMAAQDWQPINPPTSYATEQQAHQLDLMMAAQDWQPINPPTSYPSSNTPQTGQPYDHISYTAYIQQDKDILPSSDTIYTPVGRSGFSMSNNEPAPGDRIPCN